MIVNIISIQTIIRAGVRGIGGFMSFFFMGFSCIFLFFKKY